MQNSQRERARQQRSGRCTTLSVQVSHFGVVVAEDFYRATLEVRAECHESPVGGQGFQIVNIVVALVG